MKMALVLHGYHLEEYFCSTDNEVSSAKSDFKLRVAAPIGNLSRPSRFCHRLCFRRAKEHSCLY